MTLERFDLNEILDGADRLRQIAQDIPDKCMDVEILDKPVALTQETRHELPAMTEETRLRLESEEGWGGEVLEAIGSEAEANIYENAGLEAASVNGKEVLIRSDINYDQVDDFGETNLERMASGRAPLDKNSRPIELHHIGQKQSSPLAELSCAEHRGAGNDNVLHNKIKESEIDREGFGRERSEHWKARAAQLGNQN